MAKYVAPEEVNSESHIALWIYAFDFFFLIIYMIFSYVLSSMVAKNFRTVFMLYSFVCAVILTLPSKLNKKRRNYQSLFIFMRKDSAVYRPVTGKEDIFSNIDETNEKPGIY